ncbi:MAG TPA: hypothetical protein VGD19_04305 [Allosphingosinicella sp.]|jgi:hypothetical protein
MTAMIWAGTALAITAMLCLTALRAWRGWLELRRYEVSADGGQPPLQPPIAARIEMADLKERLRKLEAIATGIDL